ncbi:MAG: accessory factor UbiK family protein [Cardiobacteriaceae bacterium]|nr:accessory factor UbiK family protein [Cardiobacteriaceae bacterium]
MKTNPFNFILDNLEGYLPPPLKPFRNEISNLFSKILQDKSEKFDFVPRGEFLRQKEKLQEAEEKIRNLEAKIAEIASK